MRLESGDEAVSRGPAGRFQPDAWGQTPRLHVILPFLFETLEAFGVFVHGSDVFVKDNVLSRCWTDHLGEPVDIHSDKECARLGQG
jgi:hypothetical protein